MSRLVVDTERFAKDDQEGMSKIGMGVIYEKTSKLENLKQKPNKKDKAILLDRYYYPHHKELYKKTTEVYQKFNKALIIDCHSFATKVLPYEKQGKKRPQICIGVDDYHTNKDLANKLYEILSKKYEVEFNTPFAGSIVPIEYYRKNKNIQSVMIEIRKDNYMNEDTFEKNDKFEELKTDIQNAIIELSLYFDGIK